MPGMPAPTTYDAEQEIQMPTTAFEPELISCAACGVEFGTDEASLPAVCPICADDRQYVPQEGQRWCTQGQLAERTRVRREQLGPDQWGITAEDIGISQTMQVVRTPAGLLLWDPIALVDHATVDFIQSLGPVIAIVASHPHMYGAQVSLSRALGDPPVLINASDQEWVQRRDPVQQLWSGTRRLTDGIDLHTLGGHFPGSSIAHWKDGAEGSGVVLAGDTIMVNPDRQTVAFMRSYPNRLPLSGGVVASIAERMSHLRYRQIWSNINNAILDDAAVRVQASAVRHIEWLRGDHDNLTVPDAP